MREAEASLQQRVLTMQLIAGALVAGAVSFLAVAFFLVQSNGPAGGPRPDGSPPLLTWIAAGLLVIQAAMSLVLPPTVERQALDRLAGGSRPVEAADLINVYQTRLILTLALFEGASFFASIAYLVEGHPLAVAVSAVAVAGLLTRFPTEWRLTQWLAERKAVLAAGRARPKA